jgi:hypothetical protein
LCSFSANGGGFVTNLFYNYHIKYILDDSYLAQRYDYKHYIAFKSLKIDSGLFETVIGVFKTSGATASNNYKTNDNTILGLSSQKWTQFIYIGSFTKCYLYDLAPNSGIRAPFSNISINNGISVNIPIATYNAAAGATPPYMIRGLLPDGNTDTNGDGIIDIVYYYGLMSISGTSIELSSGSINTSIPTYESNSVALAANYPVGGIYLDWNGTGSDTDPVLKVVRNV